MEGAVGAHELLAARRIAQSAHLDCFEIKTKEVQKCIRVSHWMKSLVVTPQNQIILPYAHPAHRPPLRDTAR